MKKLIIVLLLLAFPLSVLAGAGLGLSAPTFKLGELIKGRCYDVGVMTVRNFQGDETGTYNMDVTYLQDAPERRIPREWVTFTPQTFSLEPNEFQTVDVDLCMPHNAKKTDYFAFLEVGLVSSGNINIAVATKLYFTVVSH